MAKSKSNPKSNSNTNSNNNETNQDTPQNTGRGGTGRGSYQSSARGGDTRDTTAGRGSYQSSSTGGNTRGGNAGRGSYQSSARGGDTRDTTAGRGSYQSSSTGGNTRGGNAGRGSYQSSSTAGGARGGAGRGLNRPSTRGGGTTNNASPQVLSSAPPRRFNSPYTRHGNASNTTQSAPPSSKVSKPPRKPASRSAQAAISSQEIAEAARILADYNNSNDANALASPEVMAAWRLLHGQTPVDRSRRASSPKPEAQGNEVSPASSNVAGSEKPSYTEPVPGPVSVQRPASSRPGLEASVWNAPPQTQSAMVSTETQLTMQGIQSLQEQVAVLTRIAQEGNAGHQATHNALEASYRATNQTLVSQHHETRQAVESSHQSVVSSHQQTTDLLQQVRSEQRYQTEQMNNNLQTFLTTIKEGLARPSSEIQPLKDSLEQRLQKAHREAQDIAMSNTQEADQTADSAQEWSPEEVEEYNLQQLRLTMKYALYNMRADCKRLVDDQAATKLDHMPSFMQLVRNVTPKSAPLGFDRTTLNKIMTNVFLFPGDVEAQFQQAQVVMIGVLYDVLDNGEAGIRQTQTSDDLSKLEADIKDTCISGVTKGYEIVRLNVLLSFRKVWMPLYSLVQNQEELSEFLKKWLQVEMQLCEVIGFDLRNWQARMPSEEDLQEHMTIRSRSTAPAPTNWSPSHQDNPYQSATQYDTTSVQTAHGTSNTRRNLMDTGPSVYSILNTQQYDPSMTMPVPNVEGQRYTSMTMDNRFQPMVNPGAVMSHTTSHSDLGNMMSNPTSYTVPYQGESTFQVSDAALQPGLLSQPHNPVAGMLSPLNPLSAITLAAPITEQRNVGRGRLPPTDQESEEREELDWGIL